VLPPEAAQDLLLEAQALARGTTALSRRAAVAAFAYAGAKNALGFVQGLARTDPSPAVRLEGTRALSRIYGKQAAGILAQALGDASPAVRRCAARELERLAVPDQGVPNSLTAAIARARKNPDRDAGALEEQECRAALAVLGKDSVPGLAGPARGSGDPVERLVAIAQLGRVGTDEAIAVLVGIVREPKSTVEHRDAAALAIVHSTGRDLGDPMWDELRKR
jgi:HEAT repeat protein